MMHGSTYIYSDGPLDVTDSKPAVEKGTIAMHDSVLETSVKVWKAHAVLSWMVGSP